MTSQPGPSASPSSLFIPRPFPPPTLRDVPEAYIVTQLHHLASNFWSKPETADCTIIVPRGPTQLPRPDDSPQPLLPDPLTTGPFSTQNRTAGRDGDPPSVNNRRMILKLHQDYLSAQSTFMRTILSGSSPLDLSTPAPSSRTVETDTPAPSPPTQRPSSHLAAGAFPIPASRLPRILPSSTPHHPIIFLPVPDPNSFPHLVHYIYFGTFDYIEECLHRGIITWQGIVRNVEYLGMRVELKASLGRYYRQWLKPNMSNQDRPMSASSEMEDSDDDGDTKSSISGDSGGSGDSERGPDSQQDV